MIKTPSSTVIGGAGIWTPSATIIGSLSNLAQAIKSIFANNEQGIGWDLNDFSTLYQDAAGTIPVTGVGQPVGLIKDKSGRNNHAFQSVSASRPILQRNATTGAYYLAFDGIDDFLVTNPIDFTTTDKVGLFTGVRKLSDAATTVVAELGADSITVNGTFGLFAPASGGATKFQFISRGAAANYAQSTDPLHSAPLSAVLRCVGTISTQKSEIYVNSALAGKSPTGLIGAINYGNYPLYIGRRNGTSLPFSGHIYSLICISRLTTNAETLALEKAIAKLTGVTLNV